MSPNPLRQDLPDPLVPRGVDVSDMPIPREFFARMAVDQFGISYEEAIAFCNEVADRIEGKSGGSIEKRRRHR